MAARGQREPAGVDADDGQRAALQRHQLSARRHRQPRSDPRHHRHQPDARVDRRDEDHLAELRCGVRPGGRRRGVGADASRARNTLRGSGFEFFQNDRFQSRNPFTQFQRGSADRPVPSRDQDAISSADRSAARSSQNQWFFFGDYQGTRSTRGRLAAAVGADRGGARRRSQRLRRQHLRSATGTGAAAVRRQRDSAGPAVAAGAAHPRADSAAERAGTRQRHPRQLRRVGSETFDENSFNVRIDGRLSRQARTCSAATASATSSATGRPRSAPGGGQELVSLGGVSDVSNQSLALGIDYTLSPTLLADFRFGFFRYNVNVLPFDFGTTPAADAGIPGLNFDDTFSSGLPAGFIDDEDSSERGFKFGSGLDVNRCNCPLDQDEKQFQFVGNLTEAAGQPHVQVRRGRPPRPQPARAERRAPLGRADVLAATARR